LEERDYAELLDRALKDVPELTTEKSDFVIPTTETFSQGNKTVLKNIGMIADRARRSPADIAKYLTKELGVPISNDGQQLVINGRFANDEIDRRIKRYFEVYVICKECKKPDTHIESAGRGVAYLICEACGARYGIKS
jgi:Translation initiation factor 2, beta subunit (eIF-2beta)/eIF-5 N-terminal domain